MEKEGRLVGIILIITNITIHGIAPTLAIGYILMGPTYTPAINRIFLQSSFKRRASFISR